MSIDGQEVSHIYSLLDEADASTAIRRLERLPIVPVPSFGQGLLPRLLFAVERHGQAEQSEILRTFLDRLTAEFSADETHVLERSEQSDESPRRFFELHEQFFEAWRTTLDDAEAREAGTAAPEEGTAAPEVLAPLSGALATIWRPTLYDGWDVAGPALPVWGDAWEVLHPLLMTVAEGSSPAARAKELDALAACFLGLYQGEDSQQRVLAHLSERLWEESSERRDAHLWFAAAVSPARKGMNTAMFIKSARQPSPRARGVERPAMTAAYPEAVLPGEWYAMDVYLYLRRYQDIIDREVQKSTQVRGIGYQTVKTHFVRSIPEGTRIRISPSSEDFEVNPEDTTIKWFEDYFHLPFRIRLRKGLESADEVGITIRVTANDLPFGHLVISMCITNVNATPKTVATVATQMQWYSDVFASYAHEDIAVVRRRREQYEAIGTSLFIDEYGLRTGVEWKDELLRQLRTSDIFQLFWSTAASKSPYVKWEWRSALGLESIKGAAFIRPVFWEDPMPDPPDELSGRHFHPINV